MPSWSGLLDHVPADFYNDPSKYPVTISLSPPPNTSSPDSSHSHRDEHDQGSDDDDADDDEGRLRGALTRIFHALAQHRRSHAATRTGRPEGAVVITYRSPRDATPSQRALLASFSSPATADNHGPGDREEGEEEYDDDGEKVYSLYASDFWQSRHCVTHYGWPARTVTPLRHVLHPASGQYHPARPAPPPEGAVLYARHVPTFETTLSLCVAGVERDLDHFHAWHNSERVNDFWGERGTRDRHRSYLRAAIDGKSGVVPMVGFFGTRAFGYFECYYAMEDVVGKFMGSGATTEWDRGFHALVGSEDHRGPERVRVWLSSVAHYLFLADPRTQRVVLEPRVDNAVFIGYLVRHGFVVEKEFNFPHKRAALVSITREKFFECGSVET